MQIQIMCSNSSLYSSTVLHHTVCNFFHSQWKRNKRHKKHGIMGGKVLFKLYLVMFANFIPHSLSLPTVTERREQTKCSIITNTDGFLWV